MSFSLVYDLKSKEPNIFPVYLEIIGQLIGEWFCSFWSNYSKNFDLGRTLETQMNGPPWTMCKSCHKRCEWLIYQRSFFHSKGPSISTVCPPLPSYFPLKPGPPSIGISLNILQVGSICDILLRSILSEAYYYEKAFAKNIQ